MNINLDIDWVALGLNVLGQTVILTIALWIMLKAQHFSWNSFALVGSAALACILDRIPFVGYEISGVVLLLCIKKVINSRTFTDALFSVVIAYAITFAFNMFLLGMLIGDLRPPAHVRARTKNLVPAAEAPVDKGTNASVAQDAAVTASGTNSNVSPAQPPAVSPVVTPAKAVAPAVAAAAGPTTVDTNQLNSARMAGDIMKHFFVKGVSQGATMSIAMLSNGTQNFNVIAGDIIQLPTSDGRYAPVKCEAIAEGRVAVSVDGVRVTLYHR